MKNLFTKLKRLFRKALVGRTLFVLFETNEGSRHDRIMYVRDKNMMTEDFIRWIQEHRLKIEKERGCTAVVINCKIL